MVDGKQVLCAVPVDVQLQTRLLGATAQAETAVFSQPQGAGKPDFGAVTCIVADGNGVRYAMAPIHVLSPYPQADGRGINDGAVNVYRVKSKQQRPPDAAPFLRSTRFGGRLAPEPVRSFDVQLARILDPARLQQAFVGIDLSPEQPCVNSIVELGDLLKDGRCMEILVPNNHPDHLGTLRPAPQATLSLVDGDHIIWYRFAQKAMAALHKVLELQLAVGDRTGGGDSGSPVVIPGEDSNYRFVGMHIAGNPEQRTSYVIPAWKLFNGLEYADVGGSLPPGGIDLALPF
jgi:hypothetical protein